MPRGTASLVDRAIDRSLADRRASYADEVRRIVEATYRVIGRAGSLDPTMRDILGEAQLSTQAFYRHFRSKDELLAALLDDGRRQLTTYLGHQMAKAPDPAGRVRAWVQGVLAQAANAEAADRTRPFLANLDRLTEQFAAEQRASAAAMTAPLVDALRDAKVRDAERSAHAIYVLAIAAMHEHIRERTKPTKADVDHLVQFALAGAGIMRG